MFFMVSIFFFFTACTPNRTENSEDFPRPETILKHSRSLYTALAFHVGMQLDIFSHLDKKPMTAAEIAGALHTNSHFVERLLYSLVAAEMLTVSDGFFRNTVEASLYLVNGKPDYLGDHILVNPYLTHWMVSAGTTTAEMIKRGKSPLEFDYYEMSFDDLLSSFRGTMPVAVKAGEVLADYYDFSKYTHVADVGGASGGLAAALVRKYPHLQAAVTDLSSVTPVAEVLLKEQGMNDIKVIDWDVLEGPCSETFDVAVLRALVQVLSAEDAGKALVNIGRSLKPGGAVFILGHIMDDSKINPPEEVIWYLLNLNWDDHAGFYTESDYRNILTNAGFQNIRRDTLPNGDGVIHALR